MLFRPSDWPPEYSRIYAVRHAFLEDLQRDPKLLVNAWATYLYRPADFINDWMSTFDPRNAGIPGKHVRMPFILFPRQRDLVEYLDECLRAETGGLIEKCRDMGATWTCAAFSVWLFIFKKGVTVGWGSRKEELVDHLGDMNSIFEKMRSILRNLPNVFQPGGWSEDCMSYMRIVNPEHGATIIGESGDNIGRGGRSRIYFVDEAAHVEHPEMIEASLSENTRVKIDLSSVNGPNNVFHRRRENGIEWEPGEGVSRTKANVFVMDWRDHPLKDQAWYDQKRAKAIDDGLLHVFRQEIERDYFGALTGTIVPQEWVLSAIDAHIKLKLPKMEEGPWTAALDVADGGTDVNALVKRKGVVLQSAETWGERDTGVTTRRTVMACSEHGRIQVQYDAIGVGSGIKAETNRLKDEKLLPKGMRFVPWDAGAGPNNPDGHVVPNDRDTPLCKDFYGNLKAEGWWMLRRRFELTHRAVTEGIRVSPDNLISLSSKLPKLLQIRKELSQPVVKPPTGRMKLIIDKLPEGARSPNLADAIMMCYWPSNPNAYDTSLDWVG